MKIKLITLICILCANVCFAENLYDAKSHKSLVADRKATRIGDLITLVVVESSRAESRAGTGVNKDLRVGADAFDTTREPSLALSLSRDSEKQASTGRRGFLQAQIAVVITEIDWNGNYTVKGEQRLNINNEEQTIAITGKLRPEDISRENIALSNRLANANIEFTGEGVVGDEQSRGIAEIILGWLGII